jgi:phosphohistidine phosphatase
MKTLYFMRHAKSKEFAPEESDFERSVSKKGYKDINTIGSYLKLRGVLPDLVLSSCALRAQQSTTALMEKLGYSGEITYLNQLYLTSPQEIIEILKIQDDDLEKLFIMGHHPYLTELVNQLSLEHISKIPSTGMVALEFDLQSWQDIEKQKGTLEFFIFPKQFKYYMPKQIRAVLGMGL